MTIEEYSARAMAIYDARHNAETDTMLFNAASFVETGPKQFVVTVRDCQVAILKTIREVEAFCMMHNSRILGEEVASA
jgi:hypothetical protein